MLKVVAGLFGIVAWVVLLGLQRTWHTTFGWIFRTFADLLDRVSIPTKLFGDIKPFGAVSSWLRSLDRNVMTALAIAAHAGEVRAVWLFSRLRLMFGWIGREIEGIAADVLSFGYRLMRVEIPRLVSRLLRAVWNEVRRQIHAARSLVTSFGRKLFALGKAVAKQWAKNAKALLGLTKWAAHKLTRNWSAILGVLKRLDKIAGKLTGKKFRDVLYGGLKSLGIPYIMSTNVVRTGKWLMNQDVGEVWEFVKDEMFSFDFCKLAGYQYDVAVHVVEPLMQRIVAMQDWYCTLPGDTLPSAVTPHPGYIGTWEPSATEPLDSPIVNKRLAPDVILPRGQINA